MIKQKEAKLQQAKEVVRLVMDEGYSIDEAIKKVRDVKRNQIRKMLDKLKTAISAPTKVSLIALDGSISNTTCSL